MKGMHSIAAKRLVAALAALPAIVLAGCGEDALSDGELRQRADAICAAATAEIEAVAPTGGRRGAADAAAVAEGAVDAMREDLAALKPPEDLAADLDSYIGLLGEQQFNLGELAELTQTRKRVRLNLLDLGSGDAPRHAGELGLTECVAADGSIGAQTVMIFAQLRI